MEIELEDIEYILDKYGLEKILADHQMTVAMALDVLESCRYVDLEQYLYDTDD